MAEKQKEYIIKWACGQYDLHFAPTYSVPLPTLPHTFTKKYTTMSHGKANHGKEVVWASHRSEDMLDNVWSFCFVRYYLVLWAFSSALWIWPAPGEIEG